MSADIERQSAKIVQRYCYRADERWHQAIIDTDTKLTFSAGLEVRADGSDRCSSTKTGLRKTRPKVNGARLNKETWVMSHNPPASSLLPPIAGVIAGVVALCPVDGRVVQARLYPNELLGELRAYFYGVWMPTRCLDYFQERDATAVKYLPALLEKF